MCGLYSFQFHLCVYLLDCDCFSCSCVRKNKRECGNTRTRLPFLSESNRICEHELNKTYSVRWIHDESYADVYCYKCTKSEEANEQRRNNKTKTKYKHRQTDISTQRKRDRERERETERRRERESTHFHTYNHVSAIK